MSNKKLPLVIVLLAVCIIVAVQCNDNDQSKTTDNKNTDAKSGIITPKALPVTVPGFHFPEDSNAIYSWMNNKQFPNNYDSASVYAHAWGVWAGLTASSGEVYQGDTLRIFETWLGISEIQDLINAGNTQGGCTATKTQRTMLERPKQFGHGPTGILKHALMAKRYNDTIDVNPGFWVTVSYDPDAACYATTNSILKQSVINKYAVENGVGNIPAFPQKAITIKPTYLVGSATDSLIQIPAWSGPKDTAYAANLWPTVVYADVKNRQAPNKQLVPAAANDHDPAHIAAATCNLSDFINFKVDAKMAAYMNQEDSTQGLSGQGKAVAGQIAILVAMHVTTKEISNWTWQTYYWTPDPMHPDKPSSDLAASIMPAALKGTVAGHYAVVSSYAMVIPNQPLTGGTNKGVTPIYGYNPYLESGFDTSFAGGNLVFPNKLNPKFYFGDQTNCMSCHTLATPTSLTTRSGVSNDLYTTVQYISNTDPYFVNKIRLDFAWSIQAATINDAPPAAKKKE
ncbi:MAG: hypothetical protein JST86_13640 [Bacteroidetes bacterium]|nr:hypothetical protein [Bacteroidota bacterium]